MNTLQQQIQNIIVKTLGYDSLAIRDAAAEIAALLTQPGPGGAGLIKWGTPPSSKEETLYDKISRTSDEAARKLHDQLDTPQESRKCCEKCFCDKADCPALNRLGGNSHCGKSNCQCHHSSAEWETKIKDLLYDYGNLCAGADKQYPNNLSAAVKEGEVHDEIISLINSLLTATRKEERTKILSTLKADALDIRIALGEVMDRAHKLIHPPQE